MLNKKSLVALAILMTVSMKSTADTATMLNQTSSNMQGARLEAIDVASTELIMLRSALQSYYDGNGFTWPANMGVLQASPYWVADIVSNYGTVFVGGPSGDGRFSLSVDVLQESTALSIAPRIQGGVTGSLVTMSIMAPGTEDVFAGMLHRNFTAGYPELNQMNTTLDMNGNNIINIGNASGDSFNFVNGDVSEDLTVQRDAFFNRNIQVDGTASIFDLDAETATVDALGVSNSLLVDGTATFNGQTILNGAVTLSDSVTGGDATFKDLIVDSITAANLSQFNGGINILGDTTFKDGFGDNLTLNGDLSANDGLFSGDLTVTGTSNLNDVNAATLTTTGDVGVGGNLTVDGDGLFGGDLKASDITATGDLVVEGKATFTDKVTFEGGVDLGEQPLEWSNGSDYANIKYEIVGTSSDLVIDVGNDGNEDALVIRNSGKTVAEFGYDEINFSQDVNVTGSVGADEFRVAGTNNFLNADGLTVGSSKVTNAGYQGDQVLLDDIVKIDTQGGRFYIQPFDDGAWQTNREFGYDNVSNRWYTDGDFNAGGNLYEQGERVATQAWSSNEFYTKNQDIYITKDTARLVLDSSSSGGINAEQAATISLGESGTGASSLHLAYQGDGYSYIGMGSLGADNIPDNWAMRMYFNSRDICFKRGDTLATVCATQLAVKDEVNTFTADQLFASNVTVDGNLIVKGDLLDENGNPYVSDDGAIDADFLDGIARSGYLQVKEKGTAEDGLAIYVPGTMKYAFNTGDGGNTATTSDVELFYDGQLKAHTTVDGFNVVGDLSAENIIASNNVIAKDAVLNGKSVSQFMEDCENKNGICEGGGSGGWGTSTQMPYYDMQGGVQCPVPGYEDWITMNKGSPYNPEQNGVLDGCMRATCTVSTVLQADFTGFTKYPNAFTTRRVQSGYTAVESNCMSGRTNGISDFAMFEVEIAAWYSSPNPAATSLPTVRSGVSSFSKGSTDFGSSHVLTYPGSSTPVIGDHSPVVGTGSSTGFDSDEGWLDAYQGVSYNADINRDVYRYKYNMSHGEQSGFSGTDGLFVTNVSNPSYFYTSPLSGVYLGKGGYIQLSMPMTLVLRGFSSRSE
jgi:hypothetical protein